MINNFQVKDLDNNKIKCLCIDNQVSVSNGNTKMINKNSCLCLVSRPLILKNFEKKIESKGRRKLSSYNSVKKTNDPHKNNDISEIETTNFLRSKDLAIT